MGAISVLTLRMPKLLYRYTAWTSTSNDNDTSPPVTEWPQRLFGVEGRLNELLARYDCGGADWRFAHVPAASFVGLLPCAGRSCTARATRSAGSAWARSRATAH